jgi:superfamily I DNA and/or RNA helicase
MDALLHADQHVAAKHGIFAPDVALIHGPPGTGKTRVVVEVIRQSVARGERVLALCASNAAADHVALGILDADPKFAVARAGHPARIHDALEQHTLAGLTENHELRKLARTLLDQAFQLLHGARRRSDRGRDAWRREREARSEAGALFTDARRLERQAVDEVMRKTKVLAGTLTGFARDLSSGAEFDVLVVDEASQALTPAILIALPFIQRVVLAGDHRQLPPTVLSRKAAADGLNRTLFEALIARDDAAGFAQMLTVQHRMNEDIMAFPSERFYAGKLQAHPSVAHHTLADLGVESRPVSMPERIVDVIDTAGAGFDEQGAESGTESRENPGEAKVCALVVRDLIAGGMAAEDIGVITPYSGQVALLRTELDPEVEAGLEIDSVDGFQGREKEAIVFSAVRSNPLNSVGFLADERRLNVAITRAKRKLSVILDSATVGGNPVWGALVDAAIANGSYRSCFEIDGAV